MSYSGRVAIVTGGASGIGRATALALAQRGATTIVADINAAGLERVADEAKERSIDLRAMRLDLTDAASIRNFVEMLQDVSPKADILINAAGWSPVAPFLEGIDDVDGRVMAINLMGPIRLTRALLPGMIDLGGGQIVNIASDAGRVGSGGTAVYAAAKGGLIALTKSLAREMAGKGIRVNCISPGPTDTAFLAETPAKLRDALVRMIPLGRVGRAEEIAQTILFLCSDASSYVTGQVISVNGGMNMVG